ncbi:hypothetical protein jhhlp_000035 [Lomentospora prolificans]|uniref:Autophagy-related protein 16 domain-containing protein n=1 Tax=Lomentospora prolificans TaxID=41688 RepID=A0A2N3NLF5_9PEZI|nr:hypothetical protein jhhlp_000035 [Lomentospora prolificans]
MPGWKDEYLAGLLQAEKNNPVNMELVEACSQLVDRVASLEAEKAALEKAVPPTPNVPAGKKSRKEPEPTSAGDDYVVVQLQRDLSEALRSKGFHEQRAKTAEAELEKLKNSFKNNDRMVRELTAERNRIMTKLKDRDHELREQRKLSSDVQDEMITLNLQLSMAEKERDRVKKENKELIERWMKSKGAEADKMNLDNEALFDASR